MTRDLSQTISWLDFDLRITTEHQLNSHDFLALIENKNGAFEAPQRSERDLDNAGRSKCKRPQMVSGTGIGMDIADERV